MRNRIITLSFREIRKSYKRFFSLVVLSFLGASFFVGLNSASKSFEKSANKYLKDSNSYDIKIVSSLGFDDEDIEKIKKIDNSFQVYGSKSKDVIIEKDNTNNIARINEINYDCNKIVLQEGRMPENKNEMVMEYGIDSKQNIHVGDELEIDGQKIKIVGSALSTEFLIKSKMVDTRGTSNLDSGKVSYCLYAPNEYFDFDYYTAVYVVDERLSDVNVNSSEYKDAIQKDKDELNIVKGQLETEKYDKIIEEATKKIDEEEEKVNSEIEKSKNELDSGKLELDNSKEKLDKSKDVLYNSKKEIEKAEKLISENEEKLKNAENELNETKKKLDDSKATLDSSKKELDKAEAEIKKYEKELNNAKQQLDNAKQMINDMLSQYSISYNLVLGLMQNYETKEQAIEALQQMGPSIGLDDQMIGNLTMVINVVAQIEDGYSQYNEGKAELEEQKAKFNSAKEEYNQGLQQYNDGLNQYNSGYNEYSKNKAEFDKKKRELESAKKEYNKGLRQYNEGLEKYEEGLNKYSEAEEEYNKGVSEAEEKIKSARKELENLEKATFYVSDREDNYEYSTYMGLCKSFGNLSKTFPVIFFVVAVFVSLLAMARMAIENRGEIGTLKALGFTNKEIRIKYIVYSVLATLLGGITGSVFGDFYLSYLCYLIFNDIYQIPIFVNVMTASAYIIANLFCILAIVGATLIVINNMLKQDATTLLRPISPPIGKKILLEKIKPLWNRFSFNNKIMARNIFRYKRRVIMSLLGFIGCTSLLMSGYAIKDSMLNIIDIQYKEISNYDQIVNLDGKLNESELNETFNYDKIQKLIYAKTTLVEFQSYRTTIIIPNDEDNFKTLFNLRDYKTKEPLELKDDEIVIAINIAENLKLKVGDEIEFVDSNNVLQKFKISGITENYVDNYFYMNKETYSKYIDNFDINCAFIKFDNLENTEPIIKNLNENDHILTTYSVDFLINNFKNMLGVFDSIIVILIIFSALLSFVVMYSLAYITISERQKEIATLKVLGYSEKNVDGYILKEQLNILVLGIIIGIIAGSLYANILVKNIGFTQLYLIKQIEISSYLKTAGFMTLFALIISVGVHFMLKKVKMIESLKEIE